ncbi:MAG: radical SAM protein [Anaerolineales bacterium]|nr:radical SAM protein [Anaerolineales bacterium]
MDARLAVNLLSDRLAALPLAIVYLTDRCNSRCVTCDYWRHGQTNLPPAAAQRLARELPALGAQVVLLSGGEPLLHPQWAEIAAVFQAARLRLWLLTAGLALARHAVRAAALCETITVSLDGATPATYQAIRGVDAFAAVTAGVRAAVAAGAAVTLRCTVQRANYAELPALVDLGHALGVRQVSFLPVDVSTHVAFARAADYDQTMALRPADLPRFAAVLAGLERTHAADFTSGFIAERPAKLRRLHQYFAALLGQAAFPPVACNAPRFSAVIGADGHLQPCYFIPGASQPNGAPLAQALNAPAAVALRRAIRQGERAECARCVCALRRGPRQLLLAGV